MRFLQNILFSLPLLLCSALGIAQSLSNPSNLRLDTLNGSSRLTPFDPIPGIRVGIPEPEVSNTHQLPLRSGVSWQTNAEPWEAGAVINGSAYAAVAPAAPANWPTDEVVNYYYIDPGHNACDNSSIYGYPDKPRCSMPGNNTSIAAGARIELASSNGEAGKYHDRYSPNVDLPGTREEPIWIVGNAANPPFISGTWRLRNSSWLYIENLTWGDQTGTLDNAPICLAIAGTLIDHVVVRNNKCINRHIRNRNRSGYTYSEGFGMGLQLIDYAEIKYVHFHNNLLRSVGNLQYELFLKDGSFHVANDVTHPFVGGESVYIIADEANGRVPAPLVGDRSRVYSIVNATSTSFQLAIEGQTSPVQLTDSGRGGYAGFHVLEVAPTSIAIDLDTDYHSLTITAFNVDRTTGANAHHVWFTDNTCVLGTGDCLQITGQNLGGTTADDARDVLHHLYANGNICEKQRQVCIGSKTLSHFVVSENLCVQNGDGGGCYNLQLAPTYTWYIFNTSYNTSGFSRNSSNDIAPSVSSSVAMRNYWLNNLAVNTRVQGRFGFSGLPMSGGFFMAQNPPDEAGSKRYLGWNTCVDCYSFYTNPGAGDPSGVDYYIYKNAYISPPTIGQTDFTRVQQAHYVFEQNNQLSASHFDCNLIDSRQPFRAGRNVGTSFFDWQRNSVSNEDSNSLYAVPNLTLEDQDLTLINITPKVGSAMLNPSGAACAGTKFPDGHDPFQAFTDLYGLDIFIDYYGNPREIGGVSDIGAVERN